MSELERCREALRAMAAGVSRAEDEERQRIARGLHDDVGQLLATVKFRLHSLQRRLGSAHETAIAAVTELIDETIAQTRGLTFELMAPPAIDLDITAALAPLADHIERRYDMRCTLTADTAAKPLSPAAARAVYRVVRELLENAGKHSKSPDATVEVATHDGRLQVVVTDHGVGFEPAREPGPEHDGVGLLVVKERMAEVGGDVHIDSAHGAGTQVTVWAPLGGRDPGDDR